jgi:hypothetical protein
MAEALQTAALVVLQGWQAPTAGSAPASMVRRAAAAAALLQVLSLPERASANLTEAAAELAAAAAAAAHSAATAAAMEAMAEAAGVGPMAVLAAAIPKLAAMAVLAAAAAAAVTVVWPRAATAFSAAVPGVMAEPVVVLPAAPVEVVRV